MSQYQLVKPQCFEVMSPKCSSVPGTPSAICSPQGGCLSVPKTDGKMSQTVVRARFSFYFERLMASKDKTLTDCLYFNNLLTSSPSVLVFSAGRETPPPGSGT